MGKVTTEINERKEFLKDLASYSGRADTFENYVMSNLTAAEFQKLPLWMGMSQYSTTRMFNQPKRMNLVQIEKISKILNKHPYELISHYKLGYEVVTLDEMEQITRGYNT